MSYSSVSGTTANRTVRVWDVPTRFFHWTLVVLVVVAWMTGEEESAALVHRVAGEIVAGLLVFRVVWGFVGGEHARFADFAAGPSAITAHVRDLLGQTPTRHLGHNPLGGVFVFLLLINLFIIVTTGLFSGGQANAGPFTGAWGLELSEIHEFSFRVLQALVVIHFAGVAFESVKARDGLVPAMITGQKTRRASEPGEDARRANFGALVAAAMLGLAVSAILLVQPPASNERIAPKHDLNDD